jgi:hypothetical protein
VEWEGSDWSAGWTIELAMKTWDGLVGLGRTADKINAKQEAEEVWEADMKPSNPELYPIVLPLAEEQPPQLVSSVRTHESSSSGDHSLNVGEEEVAYKADQEPEISAEGSKALEKESRDLEAVKVAEKNPLEKVDVEKIEAESSETRRSAPMDRKTEEGEMNVVNVEAAVGHTPEPNSSAEEDFEIVEQPGRHQSLIDMVLGQGKRK